ncbi:MAG: hypothetical protein COX20_12255 [Desulfobacterales bacterium CG23_combo_of_CG06-09_8_20_14_all_52_9]|nr:MAG: hypothetical protein COX20_12255 [Desulfobacterales bacterium CG23_combo_of_CG06-09_8_20_14_all_52_9]
MCLILLAYEAHPKYRLILAANRDEFYERPTKAADFWEEAPYILAGRDLKLGGTWLGMTRKGRLAAVTNYRDPKSFCINAKSRGMLVSRFLLENASAETYLRRVAKDKDAYNAFNLIAGDSSGLFCFSSRSDGIRPISPGIHGLSNRLLDTPWPKVSRGIRLFGEAIGGGKERMEERLLWVLQDREQPPDADLPDTGAGLEWERILSPIFIQSPTYGTRSSTVVLVERVGQVVFVEQTFYPEGPSVRKGPLCRFVFDTHHPG